MVKKILQKFFIFSNYLVAILLVLVYLSVFIKPIKLWPAAYFGLAYPYILFINLIFVFYWIFRRKKYLLISLITILLGWNHLSANLQINLKSETKGEGITILSYNIKMLNLLTKKTERNRNVIEYIEKELPDVICFQEIFVRYGYPFQVPFPLQKMYNIENCVFQRGDKATNYGLSILSKYPLLSKGEIRFKNSINFCLFGDYLIQKDTVRIYNIHLQSIKFQNHDFKMIDSIAKFDNVNRLAHMKNISKKLKIAFEKRSEQIHIVKKHIESSPYKNIICGDFNDNPVSYTYNQISKTLFDSFKEEGSGIGNTFISKKLAYRIDYIFHDSGFKTMNYSKGKITSSDHFPIMAKLKIAH